jgi:hypothetical protein
MECKKKGGINAAEAKQKKGRGETIKSRGETKKGRKRNKRVINTFKHNVMSRHEERAQKRVPNGGGKDKQKRRQWVS